MDELQQFVHEILYFVFALLRSFCYERTHSIDDGSSYFSFSFVDRCFASSIIRLFHHVGLLIERIG